LTHVALVFALLALGISAYSLTREPGVVHDSTAPSGSETRLGELERRVERMAEELEALRARGPGTEGPSVGATGIAGIGPSSGGEDADRLKALVDDAVEKKARSVTEKLRKRQNRKPPIEDFVEVLDLTPEQRASIESEVIRGQREAYAILETPTSDGRNLFDELVELSAASIARPGKDPGWGAWFVRVMSEKVPGTDETYATQVENVKKAMRSEFRRVFTKEQSAEYDSWQVDPLEIRDVRGAPMEQLEKRIVERTREMGADLPEDEE
jgi:hypothetical protein